MNKKKFMGVILLGFLTIIAATQMVTAVNQYSVEVGAHFRWDATQYFFMKDGPEYTHSYYLEFNFTNWGDPGGLDYLNGTINNNGTVFDGEISHEYYYGGQTYGQEWVTDILDYQGEYPVHVYLVCATEIEQTTKPELENLALNSWLTFGEPSTNNFTLTGTYIDGDNTAIYTGKVEFNSDKVLKYVYDELILKTDGVTQIIERYVWTLTYTPGTPTGGTGESIPGYSLYFVMGAIAISFLLLLRRKNLFKMRIN